MATIEDLQKENEKLSAHFAGELWATRIMLARLAVALLQQGVSLEALCNPPAQAPDQQAFRPPFETALSGTDLNIILTGALRDYFRMVREIAEAGGWVNEPSRSGE